MEGSGVSGFSTFEEWLENHLKEIKFDLCEITEILKCNTYESKVYYDKKHQQYKKLTRENPKVYMYLTLSPDKFLRNLDNTKQNRDALFQWASKWFNKNPRFYPDKGDMAWVIENGSNGDHLHLHAVFELKTGYKHAKMLKASWKRTFPNNQLITSKNLCANNSKKGEYCYAQITDPEILKDKLDYLKNELKGEHGNLVDMDLGFHRGFNLT